MTYRFNKDVPANDQEEAGSNSGFFLGEEEGVGQYDMNAKQYSQQQTLLANRCEDLTGVTFWSARGKFSEVDYHLCPFNDPKLFIGSTSVHAGIPMFWQKISIPRSMFFPSQILTFSQ